MKKFIALVLCMLTLFAFSACSTLIFDDEIRALQVVKIPQIDDILFRDL